MSSGCEQYARNSGGSSATSTCEYSPLPVFSIASLLKSMRTQPSIT